MKKFLKFLLYFILFLLLVLFTAPILFKGKIIKIANEQINNNINANAKFDDIKLSFFKQFPYLSASIKGLTVIGIDDFEGDTLLYTSSIDMALNVVSAIKMENIEVKKIAVNNLIANAIILESGKANWDIAKESTDTDTTITDTTSSDFNANIQLKTFSINNASISYNDMESGMHASLDKFNFELKGDFSKDFSKLTIVSKTDKLNFLMDGIKYLRDVALNINIDVDANIKDNIYILKENSFALNDLILKIDGSIEMPDSADMKIDMAYTTSNTDFKTLLSLVPAIYMTDFNDIKTSGKMALNGTIKGIIGEETQPDVFGKLTVQNAMFSYPDLPKKAEKINIDIDYFYDGKQMDNTTVDVNKFHIEFGGNPIDIILNLKTPISDPFINSQINSNLDLAILTEIVPLEGTELKGKLIANLDLMGNMSTIEKEQYENFKANGIISISDLYYNSPDVPKPIKIDDANFEFSPKYLSVNNLKMKIGKSDFALEGKITDFLPYVFNDKTIYGSLTLNSGTIDLNEFMTSEEATEESVVETDTTSSLEVIEVPKNIDFSFKSLIKKLYYDKLEITNVTGMIYVKDGIVSMEQLNMNMLDGNISLSGKYNTQDIKSPLVEFDIQANSIDISKAFKSVGLLGKIAPLASKATGKISLGMDFSSFLSKGMKPILKSIVGGGNLASDKIGLKNSSAFSAISSELNSDAFKEMILENIKLIYEIKGGKLFVNPFETKMGNTNFIISGEQGFDNTMDFGVNIIAPKSLFGSSNSTINQLYSSKAIPGFNLAQAENINLLVKLTGDIKKPKIKIDPKASLQQSTEAIKQEIKASAKQVIETKKEDTKAKARVEADKLIKDAEKQATEVRKQGKIAADKIRAESKANAEKLVKEAKNPLAKKAAELSAKKIKDEGEKKAKLVEKESDQKAQKIIDTAKTKSDQLLK